MKRKHQKAIQDGVANRRKVVRLLKPVIELFEITYQEQLVNKESVHPYTVLDVLNQIQKHKKNVKQKV